MPDFTLPNGQTESIPGLVYYDEKVILGTPGPVPTFMVPVILGSALTGYPVLFDSTKMSGESTRGAFYLASSDSECRSVFHPSSDVSIAYQNAQAMGLPSAYIGAISALTRAKIVITSAGPVNEITLYSRLYGAIGNYHKVKYDTGILTITPVKNSAFLVANALATDSRIYFYSQDPERSPLEWVQPGKTYTFGDNATACFTGTVLNKGFELDSNGQYKYYVDLTADIGTALTAFTTAYAVMLEYDDTTEYNATAFGAGRGQDLIDWVNQNSTVLAAQATATFTGVLPITVATATALKDIALWGAVTLGTSPLAVASDYTTFLTNYGDSYWDDFLQRFQLTPQLHLLLEQDAAVHAAVRTFANNRFANRTPVTFFLGCRYTDVSLTAGDATNPTFRANALNSQHIALFAGKIKKLAPYLSLAAGAFGHAVANGSTSPLTYKDLPTTWTVDQIWSQTNLRTLIKRGVVTYMLSTATPPRWVFSTDANTNQDRTTVWSATTNTTCLVSSRFCVNEWLAGFRSRLSTPAFIGTQKLTAADVGQAYINWCDQSVTSGILKSYGPPSSISVDANTGAVTLVPNITPPTEVLYVALRTNILIG